MNNTTNNNFNLVSINRNKLNNFSKAVYDTIKMPGGKYEYYDEYLPEHLKKYFKNPIGIYDPYGNNINPFTGKPYQNNYINYEEKVYQGNGLLKGQKFKQTYMNWAYIWSPLKLNEKTTDIINSIRNNTVTIIKAGTGVGKSFLGGRIVSQAFNYQKKVIMTLPKKLLAEKTAIDTAITADVIVGEEIGYYFKGDYMIDKNNKISKLIFTTTGSLIRKLTGDDPYLSEYSAIIIDEAHERTVQTDELILFLKKALEKRPDLKIIFISATLDVDTFKKYYDKYSFNVVDLGESTTFEITDIWEKDKVTDWQKTAGEKIMEILKENKKGDILVFVKSLSDSGKIRQYVDQEVKKLNKINNYEENPFMIGLDATVRGEDKDYAIEEFKYLTHPTAIPDKPFTRKIVFSTNVAESSLTVTGIIYVIDSGLALEDLYEPNKNANALLEKFISQSAIKQRRGRVGRTKPGICYHLYTEKDFNNLRVYPVPSIEKSDLTMDILDIMKLSYINNFGDVVKLLKSMISPPHDVFIKSAQLNLYSMEAITTLDDNAKLTPLGYAMTKFSGLPIQFARAIIASYYYHCKNDVIPIIVIIIDIGSRIENLYLDFKPKRKMNKNSAEYKREFAQHVKNQHKFDSKIGDIMTIYNIYSEFKKFMRLPKEIIQNESTSNTNNLINNNNTGNLTSINTNDTVDLTKLTKKTSKDAIAWCVENGINFRYFVKKTSKDWDKVGSEARKIDRVLMNIVQPPELRKTHHKDYLNDGGVANKKEVNEEIKNNKLTSNIIDREDTDDEDTDTEQTKKDKTTNKLNQENKINRQNGIINIAKRLITTGGFKNEFNYLNSIYNNSYIQTAGFNKKSYEVNFFPNIVKMSNSTDNILASFAHGLYINIAKKLNNKYMTCYPLTKTLCRPDPKSTISLTVKPQFLFYSELIMLREDQKELKMNTVTRFPTTIIDMIKTRYKKYIEACYSTVSNINTKNKQSYKQYGKKPEHKKQNKYHKKHIR